MKAEKNRVQVEFGPEVRFEVKPAPAVPFRGEREDALEELKRRLLQERLDEVWDPEANTLVRRAANEAAALAWTTAHPLLVFPALFEEKAERAVRQAERQQAVRRRTRELLAA